MKKRSLLAVITIVLTILLISLVSFVGVYGNKQNNFSNLVKDYSLSMELTGTRQVIYKVSEATNEVTYDENGNIVTDTGDTEDTEDTDAQDELEEDDGTYTVDEPVNKPEVLTVQNYELSKRILQNRIASMRTSEYDVRLDKDNGKIYVRMPETSMADYVTQSVTGVGEIEITDAEEGTVLLDNNDFVKAAAMYKEVEEGIIVYLEFTFTKEGAQKLSEMSKTYIEYEDENGDTIQKKVSLKIDHQEFVSTYFKEEITDGKIVLTIGTSSDNETINSYLQQATSVEVLLNSGKMPINYEVESIRYVKSDITNYNLEIVLYVITGIIVLSIIYLIYKYKGMGIVSGISHIGYIALLLLVIRYTNVIISIQGIFAIIFSIVLNYVFLIMTLNTIKSNGQNTVTVVSFKEAFIKFAKCIVPLLLISIIFTFINWTAIQSFGMTLFWGLIVIAINNIIFTRELLKNTKNTLELNLDKQNDKQWNVTGILKILLIISAAIIVIGIVMIAYYKFNIGIIYSRGDTLDLYIESGYDIKDIKQIAKEVFGGQEVLLEEIEYFGDNIVIKTKDITEEQKEAFLSKVKEKYNITEELEDANEENDVSEEKKEEETADSDELIQSGTTPNLRLREILDPYVIPLILASILVLIYIITRFKKLGILKVILATISSMLIPEAVFLSILAITRLPINRLALPIVFIIYSISLLVLGIVYETKLEKRGKVKKTR